MFERRPQDPPAWVLTVYALVIAGIIVLACYGLILFACELATHFDCQTADTAVDSVRPRQ